MVHCNNILGQNGSLHTATLANPHLELPLDQDSEAHLLIVTAAIADEPWREGVLTRGMNATINGAGCGWHHLTTAATGTGPERGTLSPAHTITVKHTATCCQ